MSHNPLQQEIFSSIYNDQNTQLLVKARAFVDENSEQIADNFYKTLSSHPETNDFLTNVDVEGHLKQSLKHWLQSLFDANCVYNVFLKNQRKVGNVHARMRVPLNYVIFAADNLKQQFFEILLEAEIEGGENQALVNLLNRTVDLAVMVFNDVFVSNFIKQEKNEQSLRHHYISHNLALEFEQSRSDLLHWHRELLTVLFHPYSKSKYQHIVSLKQSKFGLWLDHRAALLFYNEGEVHKFQEHIIEIDLKLEQVMCHNQEENWEMLAGETEALNKLISRTDWLLAQVAKDLAAMEDSKDPLTRMFTRRYLPNIIQQEISYCLDQKVRLGVIMVDLDHFKSINDTYGHSLGDTVLKQTASLLSSSIRIYDYIFRYGGEEFLIIVNNTDETMCLSIAEEIRNKVELHQNSDLPMLKEPITISLGVAIFDNHPDYEQLIDHADKALYLAKENGRNRVELYRADELAVAC